MSSIQGLAVYLSILKIQGSGMRAQNRDAPTMSLGDVARMGQTLPGNKHYRYTISDDLLLLLRQFILRYNSLRILRHMDF